MSDSSFGDYAEAPSPAASTPAVTVDNVVPHARTWRYIRDNCVLHSAEACGYPFCRCMPVAQEKAA